MGKVVMMFSVVLLLLCCGIAAASVIQQMFPSDTSYCCPCPSIRLNCTFSPGAGNVVWSFPGLYSIPNGYQGHTIDNTMINSGVSYLDVQISESLKGSYRCIAFYSNGDPQQSQLFTSPTPAAMEMNCTHGEITSTSIQIMWNNQYSECFNFSVILNNTMLATEIEHTAQFTITDLVPGTPYNVCVVAHDGHQRTQNNWKDCGIFLTATAPTGVVTTLAPTPIAGGGGGNTVDFCSNGIIGIVVCILLPIFFAICLVMVLIGILAMVCKLCCCHKAGKIRDDGKQRDLMVHVDEGTAGSPIEGMCATKVTGRCKNEPFP